MTITLLKIVALITMFIDHIGHYLPNMPEYFKWIGRVAAPIFIFAVVVSFLHTSNKKKYLLRLYIFSVFMAITNVVVNISFLDYTDIRLSNNFIATLFGIGFCIYLVEKKNKKVLLLYFLYQIVTTIICLLFSEFVVLHPMLGHYFYGALLGNIVFVEGGTFFVLFGVFLYLSRNKITLSVVYTAFALFVYVIQRYFNYRLGYGPLATFFPFADYQWMMIAALPLLLIYNKKKGLNLKYLFYIFYPAHLIIIYLILIYVYGGGR